MTYSPLDCSTLVDLLRGRALHQPDRRVYTFLADGEKEEAHLTYAELDRRARAIGAQLQSLGLFGERILLLYPPSLEYIAAFFGCLYAGGIAVPAYPPRLNRPMPRLQAIVSDAQARAALTTSSILSSLETRFVHLPELAGLHWITTDNLAESLSETWQEPALSGETLAFLQYTSGSTSTPKGVRVSHGNLLHNLAWIQKCFGVVPESRGVSWLPPYHDMGLIGGVLQPLYGGALTMLMAPVAFLQSPFRWLQAISRYQTTINGGPNFAYEFCVEKITPEQRATLDLSSWEVAFTGAEPVRPETLERFVTAFEPCGFRREAFYPCYGLAEGTLIVSGGARTALPVVRSFQTSALEQNQVVAVQDEGRKTKDEGRRTKGQSQRDFQSAISNHQSPIPNPQSSTPSSRSFVGCGQTLADQKIVIADPESLRACPPDRIGEILVSGPSVAGGYWNRPEATAQTFGARLAESGEGPFLRTGDLGFLKDGELFVTGRLKDLIIIRGRNHYPQDIELTVERSHLALQPVGGAAFSVEAPEGRGEERLVIAQEVERHARNVEVEEVARTIRQAVADQHELQVYAVVLIKTGHIPRTSSGKIQRHACRAGFLDGTLEVVGSSVLDDTAINESDEAATEALTREALLAEGAPEDRLALIGSYLQTEVARTLRVAAAQIDPQQPLSSLGLDSLMAVELQHNLESSLGVKVSMASFLEAPSLSELATEVLNQFTAPTGTPPITPAPVEQIITEHPLAYGQRALWFLYQLAPESAAYNIASAVRVRSALDVLALQRAFQALAQRHPALRTTFVLRQGEPIQEIHAQAEDFFSVEDASDWTESFLNDRLVEAAHRPFDLERGPLFKVYLFTQSRAVEGAIVLLVMHHIISDLWSLAVLMRDVGALYLMETTDAPIFEPPTLHYTDYVRWQAERLAGAEGEAHWTYWQKTLAGELPILDLPTDHPRPPIQTDRGALRLFNIRPELSQALKTLGQAQGATLYMVLLAAFQTLLHRYTGQEDLLVGSPTAGRSEAELAGLIGYFVNPIVIRADLSQNPTFESLLGRVRQAVLGAFEHQDYPLALLIERLQPARDPSRSPVFQVMFVLQKAPLLADANPALNAFALGGAGARMELGGLELESLALEQRIAQFDLTLSVGETPSGLTGNFEYNTDLFEAETIARLAEHFETLLEGIVADPRQKLSDLPLLTDVEQECLATWNETRTDALPELSLRELFERQARQTPEALAVILPATADRGLQQINYAELNQRANQLAHHLKKLGVGPEVCVGLCLERSVEMIVAILGVLKAGGAYVPLDPAYPEERLAFILEDAQASVLITQSQLWTKDEGPLRGTEDGELRTIYLDADWLSDSQSAISNPQFTTSSNNLTCIIYTSGSTGEPKGVLIQNGSLVNLVQSFIQSYQPGTGDRILPLTSVASASFVGEVLPILCAGGAVVLPDKAEFLDFAKLLTLISEQAITILSTVPSLIAGLNSIASDLPRLRLILSGGEALLANEVNQLLGSATVVNGYGLTETTICSTYHILETSDLDSTSPLPIGKPLINNQIYVLDKHLNQMPLGCLGELYIAGEGLARGYVGRPELTAERFIPNPFLEKDELGRMKDEKKSRTPFILHPSSFRLYKTGDLARYLPNGNIEFLGRDDQQVKIRGFRIELGEIESRLGRHPAVREGVVVARAEADGDKRLVAYVTPRPAQTCDADELRRWLARTLPDYMVPSAFVILATLPLTSHGKVDLKALSVAEGFAPDGLRPELRATYLAPRSEMERTIAAVWQEVLKVEKVGIQDNFFELGGHSLLLVKVHSRLQEVLHQSLVLVDLFRYPTVSTLAGYLSQAHRDTDQASFQEMQTRADKQKEFRNRRRQLLKEKS